jgi:hypothetical protein
MLYIGLVANDDIESYASIFALWLEAKAYIPIHPNQPLDRCEEVIRQIDIAIILDSNHHTEFLNYQIINTRNLFYLNHLLVNDIKTNDDELAYVYLRLESQAGQKVLQ